MYNPIICLGDVTKRGDIAIALLSGFCQVLAFCHCTTRRREIHVLLLFLQFQEESRGPVVICISVVLPKESVPCHFSWISSGLLGIMIHSGTSSRHGFLKLCQQNFTDIFRVYSLLGPGCKQWWGMVAAVLATVNAIASSTCKDLIQGKWLLFSETVLIHQKTEIFDLAKGSVLLKLSLLLV